jgi:imidazolonepropionase-like amidohydrolase
LAVLRAVCAAVLLLAAAAFSSVAQSGDAVLIQGASLIDGTGAPPRAADVLIREGRIAAVASHLDAAAGVRVVDAAGQTLLPGLFDVHTHLQAAAAGRQAADWGKILKAYLYCGVTSVADMGTYAETFEPMRRLLRSGVVAGPHISLAARFSTPGGHGAEAGRGDFFSLEVLTPREAHAGMRRLLPYHPDLIKVFTDGWRYGFAPDMTSMEEETLAAIVEDAHRAGIPVITHTVTLEKAKIAARAGADIVGHGIGNAAVDSELAGLMKKSHTSYAATLAVYESKRGPLPGLLEAILEPLALASVRAARPTASNGAARTRRWGFLAGNVAPLDQAGVAFVSGTDAGMPGTHHGYAALHELELLVQGGLTPLQAITAATGNSARALRVDAERGTVAPGKLADLLLVQGDPARRIEDILQVRRVFFAGREIDRDRLRRDIATPGPTAIPAVPLRPAIDNFESADGRSSLGTLWINNTDAGHDHTQMTYARTLRAPGNHALSVIARMSEKDQPHARLNLPLTPGAIEPGDARAYKGIVFEVRGDGEYRLLIPTRSQRDGQRYQAPFRATPKWSKVVLPFSSLRVSSGKGDTWSGADLLMLSFEIARPAGSPGWLELDNLRFYH